MQDIPDLQKKMLINITTDYDILKIYKLNQSKDEVISNGNTPRKCRFCGKKEPAVSFNKRAHVISELCGNHHLLSDYECDSCNSKFSKYERQFSQFMLFYHSTLGVVGKKGVPNYQRNRNELSGVSFENGKTNIRAKIDEDPFVTISEKEKKFIISGTRTYVPSDVYRALLKMALTIMPESEMQYLNDALRFLCDESFTLRESKLVSFRIFQGGMNVVRPSSVQLYKRKAGCTNLVPAFLFALSYSNFAFQIYIPGCSLDSHLINISQIEVPIIPTVADGVFPFTTEMLSLNSNQKVVKEKVPVSFTFEKMEALWLVPWWKRIGYFIEKWWHKLKEVIKIK